jgi:hypothetical protein
MSVTSHKANDWIVIIITAILVLACAAKIAHCANRLKLTSLMERGSIKLLATVEPNAENRLLVISWDLEGGGAGSEHVQLDGADADKFFERHYRYEPGMHYVFAVALYNNMGKTVAADHIEIGGAK